MGIHDLNIQCAQTHIPKDRLLNPVDAAKIHSNFLSLDYIHHNGIKAIQELYVTGVDSMVDILVNDVYSCAYTSKMLGCMFFNVIPAYILSNDVEYYYDLGVKCFTGHTMREMACDPDWFVPEWDQIKPNAVQATLLGSGYTYSMSSGSASKKPIAIQLDNGDHLLAFINCYYAK